jgi:hypothetical protein
MHPVFPLIATLPLAEAGFWGDVGTNLVASLLYTALLALGVIGVSAFLLSKQRKQLFGVLTLDARAPVLRIYLSRLDVLSGGSQGTDGRLATGFVGPALMQLEYQGGREICRLLEEPFLEVLPDVIRRTLEGRGRYLADVDVHIDVSPPPEGRRPPQERGTDAVVLLGSDVYSPVVRDVYRQNCSFIKLVSERTQEDFDASRGDHGDPTFAIRMDRKWHKIEARSAGRELGTIQRVTLPSGRRVLMCAGLSASATRGSAEYFARHWSVLDEQFDTDDFLVVLSFAQQEPDSPVVRDAERLRDYERRRKVLAE